MDILNIIFIFVKIKITMADFNIDKVICINLKTMDLRQIFSIAETYSWGFEVLVSDKNTGSNKLYIATDTGEVIGMEEQLWCKYTNKFHDPQFMVFNNFSPVTKKIYDRLKNMKQVKVPKVPKNERSINAYLYFLEKGYDIRMPSFDRYIEYLRNKQKEDNNDVLVTEDLSKLRKIDLQSLIDEALDRKDYTEVDRLMKFQK